MIEQIYDSILPNALSIGVDYDLFWGLNPKSLTPFVKAFSLRQKYDDVVAWNHGKYIQLAIASNFTKGAKYPEAPFMDKIDIDSVFVEDEESKAQKQYEITRQRILAHAEMINAIMKKKGG